MSLQEKFLKLWHGPGSGQEIRHQTSPADAATLGEPLEGLPVDFSHGDVDAFRRAQDRSKPSRMAWRLVANRPTPNIAVMMPPARRSPSDWLPSPVLLSMDAMARSSLLEHNELSFSPSPARYRAAKGAMVRPDYFANRKIVEFFEGQYLPIRLDYLDRQAGAGLYRDQLEAAFKAGAENLPLFQPEQSHRRRVFPSSGSIA